MGYKSKCLDKRIFHGQREHLHSQFRMVLIFSSWKFCKGECFDRVWVLNIGFGSTGKALRENLYDAQFFLHLLQRDPLGFGVDKQDHKKLKAHH